MAEINQHVESGIISLVATHKCTRVCPFCVDAYRGQEEFISLDSTRNAIAFAKSQNIKNMLLVGGEPTAHPGITDIAALIKESGIRCSLTTNYDNPSVIKKLDRFIARFNISYYDQRILPTQQDFNADLILSVLLWNNRFKNIQQFDAFIEQYLKRFKTLKFSTLGDCNDWTAAHKDVAFLENLPNAEDIVVFGKKIGQRYKQCNIVNHDASESITSYKVHADGKIATSWER